MKRKHLSRRTVLRGIGGAALSLPFLEVMSGGRPMAHAADPTAPKRYLVCVAGSSLGSGNVSIDETYVPSTVGYGYDLKPALAPFAGGTLPSGAPYGDASSEISIVTDLRIPWAGMNGGTVPAGGKPNEHHETMVSPLLCGVRTPEGESTKCYGPTSDQVVANAIGEGTRFHSLQYGVQASSYLGSGGIRARATVSYRDGGGIGVEADGLRPQVSPKAAFDELFYNFRSGMEDSEELARRDLERRTRASILDVVRSQASRLERRVGREDRQRLERHFTEIRELERLVDTLGPEASGACEELPDPGPDPSFGGNQVPVDDGGYEYDRNAGYSDEDLRAEVFNRLIHMAFACDLTRSASLMYTNFHSWMNAYPLIGREADVHQLGHSGDTHGSIAQGEILAWHYKHFASLVDRLRDTPEGDGTLLDHCALVMTHEGGYGLDPTDGKTQASHSTERMACLVAGRAGGLSPGRHIRTDNAHPAQVLTSAMTAVGIEGERLGEVEGIIPELFG